MKEQFIRFTEKDADGCGTDITTIAKVSGKDDIKVETIDRVKNLLTKAHIVNQVTIITE